MNVIKVFFPRFFLIRCCSFLGSLWLCWVEPKWRQEVCGLADGTWPARRNGNRVFTLHINTHMPELKRGCMYAYKLVQT